MRPLKLLVIEDEPLMAEVLKARFEYEIPGCIIEIAPTLRRGEDKIKAAILDPSCVVPYDGIILDPGLPDSGSRTATDIAKFVLEISEDEIVIITGGDLLQSEIESINSLGIQVLFKPCDIDVDRILLALKLDPVEVNPRKGLLSAKSPRQPPWLNTDGSPV